MFGSVRVLLSSVPLLTVSMRTGQYHAVLRKGRVLQFQWLKPLYVSRMITSSSELEERGYGSLFSCRIRVCKSFASSRRRGYKEERQGTF